MLRFQANVEFLKLISILGMLLCFTYWFCVMYVTYVPADATCTTRDFFSTSVRWEAVGINGSACCRTTPAFSNRKKEKVYANPLTDLIRYLCAKFCFTYLPAMVQISIERGIFKTDFKIQSSIFNALFPLNAFFVSAAVSCARLNWFSCAQTRVLYTLHQE